MDESDDGRRRDGPDADASAGTDDSVADTSETTLILKDVLTVVAVVVVVGASLFVISGVWPPLVAVESPSMEPNVATGDLVFIVDTDRFVDDEAIDGTGVVPLENGERTDHESFGEAGDVIVFKPDGNADETPIIHRTHYWVEEGDDWVDTQADEAIVGDTTCADVSACPAPHDGFVTKGDANDGYDQLERHGAATTVVAPEWVTAKASVRVPWLGYVRVAIESLF